MDYSKMIYPKKLENIIEYYKKLPGIGDKSAERLALATLDMTLEQVEDFSGSLKVAKETLRPCRICGNLTDKEICDICCDDSRDKNIICVLEDYKSAFSFEKVGNYKGTYHILNGLISPTEGIGYEDINLSSLIDRVGKLDHPELILALKSSIEGETTTLFIKKIFEDKDVIISRLSYGIPMGADIDYIDVVTLDKALDDRKQIS
jgi:recombination protein RecR